jgi:hypothetical protein
VEKGIELRLDLDVDVDRRRPPADENGGRSAGEVHVRFPIRRTAEQAHELPNARGVCELAHSYRRLSAARSKLTSRRMSAL